MLTSHPSLTKSRLAAAHILLVALLSFLHPGCTPEPPCLRVTCDTGQRCENGQCISTCTTPNTTCGQTCTNLQTDPQHCGQCDNKCKTSEVCSSGTCLLLCPAGTTNCDGSCIKVNEDPQRCGGCNNKCPSDQVCTKGSCQPQCSANTTNCGGSCVDTSNHRGHCGTCNNTCDNGSDCKDGTCTKICTDNLSLCNDACTNTTNDPNHCGQCNNKCPKDQLCQQGKCALSCPSYQALCTNTCIDLQTNPEHCGTCDNKCPPGQRCDKGKCTLTCQSNTTNCNGACVEINTSPTHCGKCDNPCAPREQCDQGKCTLTCQSPRTACGGSCFDLNTSPEHCGTCGNKCPSGQTCQQGKCLIVCQQGQTTCNNTCVDIKKDDKHCGTCGNACSNGSHCKEGTCVSLWALEGTTKGVSTATAVATGPQGNIFVCGHTTDTLTFAGSTYSSSNGNGFLAKLSPEGKTLWVKLLSVRCRNIAVSSTGNVSFTGYFENTVTIGTKTLTSAGKTDGFIASWSTQGTWLWAERMGGSGFDSASGIELGIDSNDALYFRSFISAGATYGNISLKSLGQEGFMIKVNADGTLAWSRSLGDSNTCLMISLATMPNGDTYLAGRGNKSCTFGTLSSTLTNPHTAIVKINAKGDFTKLITWEVESFGVRIVVADADHIYLSGDFRKPTKCGNTTLSPVANTDENNYIVRLDEKGTCHWAHSFSGAGYSSATIDSKATLGRELFMTKIVGQPFYIDGKMISPKSLNKHILTVRINGFGTFTRQAYVGIPHSTNMNIINSANITDLAVDNQGNTYAIGEFVDTLDFTHYKLANQSTVTFQGWNFFIAKNLP